MLTDKTKKEEKIKERTCIVCRKKSQKDSLLRLVNKNENKLIFDAEQKKDGRGFYICKSLNCIEKLSKNKKFSISSEELLKMVNFIKKEEVNYFGILNSMKNSGEMVFGINLFFENINKVSFIMLAKDINKKNEKKIIEKALEYKIPYRYIGTKKDLGKIFNKEDINIIAVTSKKIAKGLI